MNKSVNNSINNALKEMQKSNVDWSEAIKWVQTDLDNFLKSPTSLTNVMGAKMQNVTLEEYIEQKEQYLRGLLAEVIHKSKESRS